jgi:voltage-gated potassium channel
VKPSRPVFGRSIKDFLSEPASVRNAARVLIVANLAIVAAGSLVVRLFDSRDFPTYGEALWYVLQTVTTVGYGDVTPRSALGRVVGGIVMLCAIALITVLTAMITSTFVEASRRKAAGEAAAREASESERLDAALATIARRLDRIEAILEETHGRGGDPPGQAHGDRAD